MGLAATQTRFLQLTARKSNVEFKGQQINQQRTILANKSSNAYQSMMTLQVPTPPSSSDFIKVQYQFEYQGITVQTTSYDFKPGHTANNVSVVNVASGQPMTLTLDAVKDEKTGRYQTINGQNATPVEVVDNEAYEDAYNQYKYKQYLYEQEMATINAQTTIIQQQDKQLELQLQQLDTEQSEIKTELEALDKVIGENVDSTFKSFGG